MYLLLILIMTLNSQIQGSTIEEGIALYEKRGEVRDELIPDATNINNAISIFESLLNTKDDKLAAIYLVKSYYYLGGYVSIDTSDKITFFDTVLTMAKQYIQKYPDSHEFIYWYLTSFANWSEEVGIRSVVRAGGGEQFRQKAVDLIVMNHEYENGGGYFLLGGLYHRAPYIPVISTWPDNKKSIMYFEKSLKTGRALPVQKLYLAKALIDEELYEDAKEVLISLVNMQPDQKNIIEDMTHIEEGNYLLDEVNEILEAN